ncbi:hypothetical protein [Paenibacillus sp. N3.4]|uniref:hypothetical protein n=1 Tax=Paenibacillus sp. N3.4 TaxID=2603222 RepID=UPI0011C76522|nr:hypothetical protein [Paenibacillus sp. N3.4]TXK74470.1 hypothetical protein FU659_29315 [Paenibacillus sp. N3.4]
MATVVINSNTPKNFGYDPSAPRGTSSTSLAGGFFFYSNNPETVKNVAIADAGCYLNRAPVKGTGQVYTWHSNGSGSTLTNCILVYNPNAFPIKVSSSNYGLTKYSGAQPDSDAWLSFWNTSMYTPLSVTVQPGGYGNIFLQSGIPNGGVFGIVARVSVTDSNGIDANATLWDLAYISNSSNAQSAAAVDGTNRVRGITQGGYWNTTNFNALSPSDQKGKYYTLAAAGDTFNGVDVPWVGDQSGAASGGVLGNYGQQMNITLPIYNDSGSSRTYRIFIGSTGGKLFPCFYYQGVGYRYSPSGQWGDVAGWSSLDILEVTVGAWATQSESFQVVVPAVSSTPLAIGARLL